ncbi:site-specific integrase [Pseudomonas corrugata]|uniref:site-specific integrase n=1 Tax=Pseudomonas corrugata TaxID=47879 RepID=UPI0006D8C6C4|nr:site-specific integrase [Pseudomonas corrugata]
MTDIRRATSLRPGQFKHLVRVASVTERMPARDVLLIWITHTTGIRVTELAQLEVADVLYPSGAVRPELYLRPAITKRGCVRNVYLTHPRCLDALEEWFAMRHQRGWGLSDASEYRSSHSGRRTLAAKVLAATGDVDTVQTILGHSHLDHAKPYLSVCRETIRRAFEVAL